MDPLFYQIGQDYPSNTWHIERTRSSNVLISFFRVIGYLIQKTLNVAIVKSWLRVICTSFVCFSIAMNIKNNMGGQMPQMQYKVEQFNSLVGNQKENDTIPNYCNKRGGAFM